MTGTGAAATVPALLHLTLRSQSVTEFALAAGYDGVVVDLQHGEIGIDDAVVMLRSLPRERLPNTWARVPSIDSGIIGRLLDSGARGIVAPTVESAEAARALVAAVKYPPLGGRSLGPSRPALDPGDDPCAAANRAVSAIVQLETAEGVARAEEILAVEGVDAVYLGPADLAVTHGLPGRADWEDGPVRDAIVAVSAAARARGIAFGVYCTDPAYAAGLVREGLVDVLGVGIDLLLIARATRDTITTLRSTP